LLTHTIVTVGIHLACLVTSTERAWVKNCKYMIGSLIVNIYVTYVVCDIYRRYMFME